MKIIRKKIVVIMLIAICLLMLGNIGVSNATANPLAELYFYNHGEVYNAYLGSNMGGINTTSYLNGTNNNIANSGYNSYAYVNVQAGPKAQSSVIRTLANDAVFFIHAHAGKGRIACVDSYNRLTRISGNIHEDNMTYSLENNFQYTVDKLKRVKIAYWMGCNTYGTDPNYGFGSLNARCTSLGVDCVITHNSSIYSPYSDYFMLCVAYYGRLGNTVASALANAKMDTLSTYGYTNNTASNCYKTANSYKITGANTTPSTVRFKPSSYGTY